MFTICAFLVLTGFFQWYATSKKAVQLESGVGRWLHAHAVFAKASGVVVWLVAAGLLVWNRGAVAGMFLFMILLMGCGSLLVIMRPVEVVSVRFVLLLLGICLISEILI